MTSPVPRWLVLGVAVLVQASVWAKSPTPALTSRDRALFAWFDALGLNDFTQAPLVRVRTGQSSTMNWPDGRQDPPQLDEPRAFLLWQKDDGFRVRLGDLRLLALKRKGSARADLEFVGYSTTTYAGEVATLLKTLRKKERNSWFEDRHLADKDQLVWPAQALILARYGAAHGQEKAAAELLRETRRLAKGRSLEKLVGADLSRVLAGRLWAEAADPHLSRREMLRRFRWIEERCGALSKENRAWVSHLEAMAEEDETRPALSEEEFRKRTLPEQIRELVHRLRDHTLAPPAENQAAFQQLVALGKTAVPTLLEALRDERPGRLVWEPADGNDLAEPAEIRDVAHEVLNEIAGYSLYPDPYDSRSQGPDRWRALREGAAFWAVAVDGNWEGEWLEARIARGDVGAPYDLEKLEKRYPERLQARALEKVREAPDPATRAARMRRLWKLRTPEVDAFFKEELAHGTTLEFRGIAAHALLERGDPLALVTVLAEWRALPHPIRKFGDEAQPDSLVHLLRILMASDSAEAYEAVRQRWTEMSQPDKETVVYLCDWQLRVEKREPAAHPGARALLMEAVTDEPNPVSFEAWAWNKTVPEEAAEFLTRHWPKEFHFEFSPYKEEREKQLAGIRREVAAAAAQPR